MYICMYICIYVYMYVCSMYECKYVLINKRASLIIV